jgi:hypothetical protein
VDVADGAAAGGGAGVGVGELVRLTMVTGPVSAKAPVVKARTARPGKRKREFITP